MDYVPDPRWKTDGDYAAKLSYEFNFGYDPEEEEDEYDDYESSDA